MDKYFENILLLKEVSGKLKNQTIRIILEKFDSIDHFKKDKNNSLNISQYEYELIKKHNFKGNILEAQIKVLKENSDYKYITIFDEKYPLNLRNIYNPPLLLFYEGSLDYEKDQLSIAIVGSRKISNHGREITIKLAEELSQIGLTIISGLAMGADNYAHIGAVRNKKRTIGVIGSGLNHSVVLSSRKTRRDLLDFGGAVISPFLLGTVASSGTFPARNRIISGLSLGVIITEAKENSGSLITASYAIEQNREVFAVPNRIFVPAFKGTNNLIKKSEAKLITCIEDVVDEFPDYIKFQLKNILTPVAKHRKFDDPLEEKIFNHLSINSLSIDSLCELLKTDPQSISSKLMIMEIDDIITTEKGYYKLKV